MLAQRQRGARNHCAPPADEALGLRSMARSQRCPTATASIAPRRAAGRPGPRRGATSVPADHGTAVPRRSERWPSPSDARTAPRRRFRHRLERWRLRRAATVGWQPSIPRPSAGRRPHRQRLGGHLDKRWLAANGLAPGCGPSGRRGPAAARSLAVSHHGRAGWTRGPPHSPPSSLAASSAADRSSSVSKCRRSCAEWCA